MGLAVFYTLLQLLLLLALGFGLSRFRGYPRALFQGLNRLTLNVALPVYFFVSISQTSLADISSGWIFPIASACLIALGLAFSAPLFRILRFGRQDRRTGMALSTFGNSGYIPLALMEIFPLTLPAIAGKFSPVTASVYIGTYLLVNSPVQWTLGNWLIAGHSHRPKVTELITPPFVGILAGLAVVVIGAQGPLFDQHLPFLYAFKALEKVGNLTLPLIMICLGAMIAELSFDSGSARGMLRMVAARAERNEHHVSFTLLVTYLLYILVLPLFMYVFIRLTGT